MLQKRYSIKLNRTERPKAVLLFGPTGVGKTALLEKLFTGHAEVVSADALQVYRGMDIGTAKPSAETLWRIPHHLIDILDVEEEFNIGEFCRRADTCIRNIYTRGLLPVISGGTAYYMKGWLMGLPQAPPADKAVRAELAEHWKNFDNADLRREAARVDPKSVRKISVSDRYRLLRVLEVYRQSGKPLSSFPVSNKPREDYQVLSIGLKRPAEELKRRITERIDAMLRSGLQEEVSQLRRRGATYSTPGMKGIGYREWFGTEDNPLPSTAEVREQIIRSTRRYARRQMTFFSSLPDTHWLEVNEKTPSAIRELLTSFGLSEF